MCTPLTQADWLRKVEQERPAYVATEYFNAAGDRALLISESDGWYYVVLDASGEQTITLEENPDALVVALAHLTAHGYTLTSPKLYQGKTMEEWASMSEYNQKHPGEHVHPEMPHNPEEMGLYAEAFLASATPDETTELMMHVFMAPLL
jgi:hypothetical protein